MSGMGWKVVDDLYSEGVFTILILATMLSGPAHMAVPPKDWPARVGLGIAHRLSVEIDHPHYATVLGKAYCSVVVGILNYMMFQGNLRNCTD
jgi:hypothetical protein